MFERLLIAVDGSDCATRAARVGVAVAAKYGGTVDAVAAAHDELDEDDAQRVLADVEAIGEEAGVTVESRVVTGRPARSVVSLADEVDAGAIVVGRHGHSGFRERLLGSTTERVLRNTDRHVLTVPAGDEPADDYTDVLLPTDGSEDAAAAAAPAIDLASTYGATLHVLGVVDVVRESGPFSAGGVDQAYVDRLLDAEREGVDALADDCADRAGGDLATERAAVTGTPSESIVEYVAEEGVDIVVMSSSGQSSLTGQLLGSTTDRVLRTVDEPVLVVHP
ncbi:universal stress protein [Haloarchaeobius iranensis]|uniref:Nucleotide-binding universal stress protein, UspA family n=1 Tax=Haloarchaeobius iranensis TaxID=996166 RepID=A0A1G9TCN5_9EURY|nr:universal stress protein [Haloarchaeobius iranensis]SDM45398.1 Nucleotide-binding universal stress protein, UspA family [Haloarchaeobius iranensis]